MGLFLSSLNRCLGISFSLFHVGMALNSGGGNRGNYGNDSPPYTQNITSYDTNNGGGYDATSSTSSAYSPTHTDSPTGSVPSTTANGYSQVGSVCVCVRNIVCIHIPVLTQYIFLFSRPLQVPAFTGSPPNSYAVSYWLWLTSLRHHYKMVVMVSRLPQKFEQYLIASLKITNSNDSLVVHEIN